MRPYANRIGYSDVIPFEVLRAVNAITLEVREMMATELPWDRKFVGGGFLGHVTNQDDQKWDIQPDKDGDTFRIRQHKDGKWYDRNGSRYILSLEPSKFYDFNF